MQQGWIKLHRELMNKVIWTESTPEQKTILITLLMMANHTGKQWEFKGEKYEAKAGQFVTSLQSIAEKSGKGVTIQNVRTSLKRFEKYDFLTSQPTNRNRLITIVNWGLYQQENEELTSQLTSNQQATNKQLTTNKNVRMKECKKESKEQHLEYVFLKPLEYERLTDEYLKQDVDSKIEDLDNYLGAIGKPKKYKDHNRVIRQWLKKDKVKTKQQKREEFENRYKSDSIDT